MSTHPIHLLPPGATLGVLGGGQLGRMFAHAAQAMGYFTAVLDADADSPAGRISHHHSAPLTTTPTAWRSSPACAMR